MRLLVAPDFATAVEHGYLHYYGEPCPRCRSTVKHLANQLCLTCHRPLSRPLYSRSPRTRARRG
jgi:hypothetical protein